VKEKLNLYGKMESSFSDSGKMVKKMDMESGSHQKEIITKEIGKIINKTEGDYFFILEDQNIMGILKIS
jgi:hypothetical protein